MFAGIRHCGWTLQRNSVRTPAGGEHWWNLLHWQRSSIWYLLQDIKTYFSNLWWSQPLGICKYEHVVPYIKLAVYFATVCLFSNIQHTVYFNCINVSLICPWTHNSAIVLMPGNRAGITLRGLCYVLWQVEEWRGAV